MDLLSLAKQAIQKSTQNTLNQQKALQNQGYSAGDIAMMRQGAFNTATRSIPQDLYKKVQPAVEKAPLGKAVTKAVNFISPSDQEQNAARSLIQGQGVNKKQGQSLQEMALQLVMGMSTPIPDQEARIIPQIGNKLDTAGRLSIEEMDKVLTIARNRLKIPQKDFSKLSTQELIAELRSLLTKNQEFAFGELKGL